MTSFEAKGAGYVFTGTWGQHRVVGEVQGIQPSQRGFSCDVSVSVGDSTGLAMSEVVTVPINTGSASGRDTFWRTLNRRRPKDDYDIDWELWVHQLCNYIKEHYSRGIPDIVASEIWDDVVEENIWLVEPFILQGKANVLYGTPSSGKSMLALFWAVLMDTGHVDSSHGVVAKRANCIMLDWEEDQESVIQRLKWIHTGLGIQERSQIVYKRMTRPLIDEVDTVRNLIYNRFEDDGTPTVVICDSQGMATAGQLSDEEQVVPYFTALRMIPATSLTLSHTNKDNKPPPDNLFGSQYTLAETRNLWQSVSATVSEQVVDVELHHRKANSVGKRPMKNYRISFERDPETKYTTSVTLKSQLTLESSISPSTLKIPQLVLEIIKFYGAKTVPEIVEYVAEYQKKLFASDDEEKRFRGNIKTILSRSKDIVARKEGEITRYYEKGSVPDEIKTEPPREEARKLWTEEL